MADDPAAFADALLSVLCSPALGKRLIEGGRSTVLRFRSELVESQLRALAFVT